MLARVGSETAAAAAAAAHGASGSFFLSKIRVLPFGVLGVGKAGRNFVQRGPAPAPTDAIVDPAGLHHIQPPGGPSGAGGAAGSIYRWAGIANEARFRKEVIEQVTETAAASTVQDYGEGRMVIHVVGPRLQGKKYAGEQGRASAVASLAVAYGNVLSRFATSDLPALRLLPISGGIFAGRFIKEMPEITWEALGSGFARLSEKEQKAVLSRQCYMCIFDEEDVPAFEAALLEARERTGTE